MIFSTLDYRYLIEIIKYTLKYCSKKQLKYYVLSSFQRYFKDREKVYVYAHTEKRPEVGTKSFE